MGKDMAKSFDIFDINDDFLIYKERLELWFLANKIIEDTEKKIQLLTSLSVSVYKLLRNACSPETPNDKSYAEVIKMLTSQFVEKTNVFKERKKFYAAHQADGEKVLDFYNKIQALAVGCEFGANLSEILRDKFVCGLSPSAIYDRLCEEKHTITSEECVKIAQAREAVANDSENCHKIYKKSGRKSMEHKAYNNNKENAYTEPDSNGGKESKCNACGKGNHNFSLCRYRKYRCKICNAMGHLAVACKRHARQNKHNLKENNFLEDDMAAISENDEEVNQLSLFSLELKNNEEFQQGISFNNKNNDIVDKSINSCSPNFNSRLFTVTLKVNNIEIIFEVDTGSAISALPLRMFKENFSTKLEKYNPNLKAYNGEEIKTAGCFQATIEYKGMLHNVSFVVVDKGCRPLIGRDIFRKLNFEINMNMIGNDVIDKLLSEFNSVFNGRLGEYQGDKINLKFKDNAQPIFIKPRPVPFAYKEKLEQELEKLEREGVISKIDTSRWGTPLVTVIKKDGGLRVCGDYSVTVNRHLVDINYPLPRIENLFQALQGGKLFSKIDLSQAYHQLVLDEESSENLAWSTHKGIFRVNRLPYGCKPNTSIFQCIIEKTLLGCNGTGVFVDDIIVTGETEEKHIKNLKAVLEKLKRAGFKANRNKCAFFQNRIQYLGYIIDADGLHKDRSKVNAITSMPNPKTTTEIRAFCGMVNYYSRFMPNLSSVLKPLYDLTGAKEVVWSTECTEAVEKVKKLITSDIILAHFDPDKPIVISTDASESGIGACLSHAITDGGRKPIAFSSRVLSKAERNYSTIDREALAIHFAVKKFEQYVLGKHFSILTDHKPLVAIFGSRKGIPNMAASRLQRWAIYLSNFDFSIRHIPGKENCCADALSRLTQISEESTQEEYSYLNFVKNSFERPINSKDVAEKSKCDPVLKEVIKFVAEGWPETKEVKNKFSSFYDKRNSLTLEQGVLMWGHRVVIPSDFRKSLLEEIHTSHFGIVKLKAIARSYFWWPKIDSAIEDLVKQCETCRVNQSDPKKVQYVSWPESKLPFERIHIDFCGPIQGSIFLVLSDTYSRWLEVFRVKTLTTEETIMHLKKVFAQFGIASTIVSDNARTFTSAEFQNLCKRYGIKHILAPPYHPASNGQAENAVRIFKTSLYKILSEPDYNRNMLDEAVSQFLYMYRNSAHATTKKSPFELMFGRTPNLRWELLKPNIKNSNEVTEDMKTNVKRLDVNDIVYAKDFRTYKWLKARIIKIIGVNSYLVETENNKIWKRHANHITLLRKSHKTDVACSDSKFDKKDKKSLLGILNEKAKISQKAVTITPPLEDKEGNIEVNREIEIREDALNVVEPPAEVVSNGRPKRNVKKPDKLNL